MKTIYILLTRSGTLLSNLVYAVTGANYTHASLAFDEDLSCLYSSTRKNGYTMFPAGPSREYLNRGVFLMRENIPCALYELNVTDQVYENAKAEVERMMQDAKHCPFNLVGLLLCRIQIPFHRENQYFCSEFVSELLSRSHALAMPKVPSLMRPNDYAHLSQLRCRFEGRLNELLARKELPLAA